MSRQDRHHTLGDVVPAPQDFYCDGDIEFRKLQKVIEERKLMDTDKPSTEFIATVDNSMRVYANPGPDHWGPHNIPLDSKYGYMNPNSPDYFPDDPFQEWRGAQIPDGFTPPDDFDVEAIMTPPAGHGLAVLGKGANGTTQ